MCERCNDVGYLSVRNGDDDVTCPVCNNEPGVTVAVEAPLSQEAVIRLELCTLQNAIKYAGTLKSFYAKREIDDAEKALTYNAAFKINTLLGIIDAQRTELEALKGNYKKLHYAAEVAHHFTSKTHRVIVSDPTLYNREIASCNEQALSALATVLNELDKKS